MQPGPPKPVKLFVGILFSPSNALDVCLAELDNRFGEIDYQSPEYPFGVTDYYAAEMGAAIKRLFVSHAGLIDPGQLPSIKLKTNEIEATFASNGRRTVNLDPGYLDFHKVILASAKYNNQKVYLGQGIYADPTLWYEKGKFIPYKWSFPDFKMGIYDDFFFEIRARYKEQAVSR
jgi:hypothetical protein